MPNEKVIKQKQRVAQKRLSSDARSELILDAAQAVFAEFGFEGARSQQIAVAAGISDSLIFRYFSSKRALYKAVLQRVMFEQDTRFEKLSNLPASTKNLISSITEFMGSCVLGGASPNAHGARLLLASLSRDGSYASLVYRRASKLWTKGFADSLAAAHQSGDACTSAIEAENAHAFVEHIGTMLLAAHLNAKTAVLYEGDRDFLVRDAVWFACRGIGVTDAALTRHFAATASSKIR